MFLNALFIFSICINLLGIATGHGYHYDPNIDIRKYLTVERIPNEPDTQPAVEEIKTEYISPYNIPEIANYSSIAPINTVSPNISSFRSVGDYAFYNLYSNSLDEEQNTKGEALRYSCWDPSLSKYKSSQCYASCRYAYVNVCQQRGCHQRMISRATTLCKYLCAAEFE